ncbi:MAG: autotransporter domain-containing protein [Candidatus Didemnitutus sp.]|nr:autotransporter domain-containing protein [Candidatus Didemnitutus sp.]
MSKLRSRFVLGLAALGLVSSLLAQPAPRSYSSYFFFGDSLTDNGNTFALTGSPPAPYFNGRVSNGITYAEYLRSGLVAHSTAAGTVKTNINFAFAGATAAPGSAVPNLAQQIGLYQSRAITAGANDLFVLLAGANDVLNTIGNPATQNGPAVTAAAITATTAVAGAVQSLATLGAKNILVLNLPDISKTARFVTGSGAPAATLAQAGSLAFNNDIAGRIGRLTLPADAKVTVFDLSAIFNRILADPARFGFTNVSQEFLGNGMVGDVNTFVFWDGIHPTTKAHAIFATVLTEVLNPEFVLGTSAVQGSAVLVASDMSADVVTSRLDLVRSSAGRTGAHGYVGYSYKDGSRDYTGYTNQYNYTGSVMTAGVDWQLTSNIIGGVALTVEKFDAKLGATAGSFKLGGQVVTAYGQWKSGPLFVDATASYGSQDLRDISRKTAFGGYLTSGKTKGDRLGGSVRLGGDFGSDEFHFSPFVGVRYTKAELDGYSETGVTGLNYEFDSQSATAFAGLVGATADWRMIAGDKPLYVNLFAVLQSDLGDDTRQLSGRLSGTLSATTRTNVVDGLDKSIKVGGRLVGTLSKRWGWAAGYTAEFRDDGNTASQYSFSIQTGF